LQCLKDLHRCPAQFLFKRVLKAGLSYNRRMKFRMGFVLFLSLLAPYASSAQDDDMKSTLQPNWVQEQGKRHTELISQNGSGTDTALAKKLLAMRDKDQAARGFHDGVPSNAAGNAAMAPNLAEIDHELTVQLKEIVREKGWPTISLVGIDASDGAMLILIHTADHEWQQAMLPELEKLAKANKIDGSGIALVVDKELVAAGKLQHYGSQFKIVDGEMEMYAVEDPSGLNQRRSEMLLPPMDVYLRLMAQLYHLKTSGKIAIATPEKPVSH
jgi:hypothetical protein